MICHLWSSGGPYPELPYSQPDSKISRNIVECHINVKYFVIMLLG
jgi:hypothetical protein